MLPADQDWIARAQHALARNRIDAARRLAESAVAGNSKDAAAWHMLGLVRQKAGEAAAAAEALGKAVSLDRDNARYHHDLANALADDSKVDRAITSYRRALRLDSSLAEAHNDLGTAYFGKSWHEQAEQCFRKAIQLKPEHAVAHANLGAALRAQGQFAEGRRAFQRALFLKVRAALPSFMRWKVDKRRDVARTLERISDAAGKGRLGEAKTLALRAERAFPDEAEIVNAAAGVLAHVGDTAGALDRMRRALRLDPDRPAYLARLSALLLRAGDAPRALQAAEAAVRSAPDLAAAHAALSAARRLGCDLAGAEHAARRAVELDPRFGAAHDCLAMALWPQEKLDQAISEAREAARLDPSNPAFRLNLAIVLLDAGRMTEASGLYHALEGETLLSADMCLNMGTLALYCNADPAAARSWYAKAVAAGDTAQAVLSDAVTDLLEQRFEPGWVKFEARKRVPGQRDRHDLFADFPAWDERTRRDERLVVYGEQGLGDEILFASMLPSLVERADRVTLLCDQRLVGLFRRSFPGIEVLGATYEALPALRTTAAFALAAGSLGLHFRRFITDFPAGRGYLTADASAAQKWRERLAGLGPGPKIGLSWRGGTQTTGRHRRSLTLETLSPLLKTPGVTWISVQHGDYSAEAAAFTRDTGVPIHAFPGVTRDMDELASLIDALDRIVTVSNTTVHVAGALGKDTLVMLPFVPLWPYGIRGATMPWYPTARLFRQRRYDEWDDVVASVAEAVRRTL